MVIAVRVSGVRAVQPITIPDLLQLFSWQRWGIRNRIRQIYPDRSIGKARQVLWGRSRPMT
jgi:hypothetical protein